MVRMRLPAERVFLAFPALGRFLPLPLLLPFLPLLLRLEPPDLDRLGALATFLDHRHIFLLSRPDVYHTCSEKRQVEIKVGGQGEGVIAGVILVVSV